MHPKESILRRFFFVLLTIYVTAFLALINSWGVIESSEARYAEISREMFLSGDLLHPRLLNIYHFHKPPFTYWMTLVGFKLFGVNTVGVRFFLVISIVVQLLLVYRISLVLLRRKALAFSAALIYSTMPLVLISIKGLTTDAYLNNFVLLAVFSFIEWRRTQKVYWLYLIAIACGLGFLTKGPLILIIPTLFLVGFSKLLPAPRYSHHHILAAAVFLATALSWFLYLISENRELLRYFLFHQTYVRVAQAEVFSRDEPVWFYLFYAPIAALPWSIILLVGFAKSRWQDVPKRLRILTVYMVVLPLSFFSLVSSKLILYVLPVFPFISIIIAYFISQPVIKRFHVENYVFGFFICTALSFYAIPLVDNRIVMSVELLASPIVVTIILVILRVTRRFAPRERMLFGAFVFTTFLLCYSARFMNHNELKVNSTRPLAEWIKVNGMDKRTILVYGRLLPSLAFNLNQQVISLHDGHWSLQREVNFEPDDKWRDNLYDLRQSQDIERLLPLLKKHPLMIVKGELNPRSQWIEKHFIHKHQQGPWMIYY